MAVPYWRLSGFYFFYFATVGGFIPYWSLYLKENGFSSAEIGELSALLGATRIVAPMLWGWVADRTGKSLRIIRIACFFAALIFAGFIVAHGYFYFALLSVAFSIFWNAALPQFEAVTLFHLKQQAHRYSRIRLWGSIGFIAAVLGIGRLLDMHVLSLLPWIVTGLLSCIWLVSLMTPAIEVVKDNAKKVGMLGILKQPEVLAFFAVNMLLQLAHAPYYVFYSLYLKQHDYSTTLTGGLWALAVVAEIVLFINMARVFKRYSMRRILLWSILLAVVRWLMIAWGASYLWVLVCAQFLHAATFAGVHAVAILLVYQYFGQHHQGKGQALYSSLSFGLGGMLGSYFSGYYWELLGAQLVYSIAAGCCGLALLIAYLWIGRENGQNKLLLS
ncbi:MAG: MFS transporter [Methylococcaceae bacterium]|nr:MFS transporter [Methylococcaceae bacterium]